MNKIKVSEGNSIPYIFILVVVIASILLPNPTVTSEKLQRRDKDGKTYPVNIYEFSPANEMPIINASEYDGENDTVRLQAALDDVPVEGAIVLIPPRVWVAAGLRAKSNTLLVGVDGTVIKRPENVTEPFLTFVNASNFAVLNLTFEGENVENSLGILIMDCQGFTVQDNVFFNISRGAVKVVTSINGCSRNFTILNNLFVNCHTVPIHLFGIPSRRAITDFLISNNVIVNGTRNGKIGVAFSANGTISHNMLINCQHGIATRCVSNIKIIKNRIENITDYGIYLGTQIGDPGTSNITIRENTIYNCRVGITRYYGGFPVTDVKLINNLFLNNREYDIIADFPGEFLNNTITDPSKLKIVDPTATFIEMRTVSGQIFLPGDVNHDLKIDIHDVAVVAVAFGSDEQSPNWNALADVIADGKIDIKDVSYMARNFGIVAKTD